MPMCMAGQPPCLSLPLHRRSPEGPDAIPPSSPLPTHAPGDLLRSLLRFDSPASYHVQLLSQRGAGIPVSDVQRLLPQPWSDLITSYLQAMLLSHRGEWLPAAKEFRQATHCRIFPFPRLAAP